MPKVKVSAQVEVDIQDLFENVTTEQLIKEINDRCVMNEVIATIPKDELFEYYTQKHNFLR